MFDEFAKNLQRYYVFDVRYKDQSLFMKLLGFLLFFNKKFMTGYVTTIGNTIYFPSKDFITENEESSIITLAHEVVHVAQAEKYGKVLFSLMYLFPQCLALLSLGAIFAVLWLPMLWCLVFLVFVAPIPAPLRMKFEVGGYTMSLFMIGQIMRRRGVSTKKISEELLVRAVFMDTNNFKGPNYWFMWPFNLDDVFEKKINDISNGVISDTDEVYGRVSRSYLNAVTAYEL